MSTVASIDQRPRAKTIAEMAETDMVEIEDRKSVNT